MAQKSTPTRAKPRQRQPRSDGGGHAVKNEILLALPRKECDLLFSKLTLVKLRLHDVLQEAGEPIEFSYFPNTAMASVLNIMADGRSVEVGLAGKEGFVGLPLIAGFRTSPNRINTQSEGMAFEIDAQAFRGILRQCPELARRLLRYSQVMAMEVTQLAACNRLHEVDERLARWLLMSHDRIGTDALPLTQEFLAQMLGTRRASVSVAASILQRAGLIKYARGHVTILNRPGLEEATCECYGVMRRQLESWQAETH
jgi:CRP-like cAMP-binding protein